jgi:stage V sporulation protein AC
MQTKNPKVFLSGKSEVVLMKHTPQTYDKLVKDTAPKTHTVKNCIWAFIIGGFICCLGQGAFDIAMANGMDKKSASAVASVFLIFLAALLTALNVFDKIGNFAGAGTLVPITGFANSVVSAAMEFKSEGLVFGTGVKIFNIAGPVILYGTLFSAAYGVIALIFGLV